MLWFHPVRAALATAALFAFSQASAGTPHWLWSNPQPTGNFVLGLTWGNDEFVGVDDAGMLEKSLDGVQCRVEDVTLMPELAKSLDSGGWIARLWITPDHKPMRLTIARKGWNIVLRFDDVQFAKELPADTWKPTPDQAGDVLNLEPKEYSRFLRGINRLSAP